MSLYNSTKFIPFSLTEPSNTIKKNICFLSVNLWNGEVSFTPDPTDTEVVTAFLEDKRYSITAPGYNLVKTPKDVSKITTTKKPELNSSVPTPRRGDMTTLKNPNRSQSVVRNPQLAKMTFNSNANTKTPPKKIPNTNASNTATPRRNVNRTSTNRSKSVLQRPTTGNNFSSNKNVTSTKVEKKPANTPTKTTINTAPKTLLSPPLRKRRKPDATTQSSLQNGCLSAKADSSRSRLESLLPPLKNVVFSVLT